MDEHENPLEMAPLEAFYDDSRVRYYDLDGNPMKFSEWARTFEARKDDMDGEWRIGHDERYGIRVSTVWLGLDHNFWPEGPPLIFETMIFGGKHDQYQERYATRAEAALGHELACRLAFTRSAAVIAALKGFIPIIPMPPIGRWRPKGEGTMSLYDAIRGFPDPDPEVK